MSGVSPNARQPASTHGIAIRRVQLSDPSQLPSDYSQTPGGTLFSTTPGGTRIVYDKNFLMQCRNSPLAKSPPPNLPKIPGVTSPDNQENGHLPEGRVAGQKSDESANAEEPQFQMDI